MRRLTHRRAALVSDRTRLKNRLHSILHHTLVPLPGFDLFSKRGIVWLRELPLAEEEAQARDSDLRLLEQTELEIAELEKRLVREAWQDEKVRLVMSIPGIDYTVAQTCLAAIGDGQQQRHFRARCNLLLDALLHGIDLLGQLVDGSQLRHHHAPRLGRQLRCGFRQIHAPAFAE